MNGFGVVPGENNLDDAFLAIGTDFIDYLQYDSRTLNDVGQWVTKYKDPVPVEASVQAVSRSVYVKFGLDFQKNYIKIFVKIDVQDIDRDMTGDRFLIYGKRYQIETQSGWFNMDGWVSAICVEVDYS